MIHEWHEIPIEDVQPGDVARCNGREWSVVSDPKSQFKVELAQWLEYSRLWYGWKALGFTFHRKVKREPWTTTGRVINVNHSAQTIEINNGGNPLPHEYRLQSMRVRITELLDGEDGS